jgi:hypothetical protein
MYANQYRFDWENHLCKPWLGLGSLHAITLEEEDFFPTTRSISGGITYTYPDLVGDAISLSQVDTLEDMIYGMPTRMEAVEDVESTSYLVWDSDSPTVFNSIPDAQALYVLITDSDEWLKKTESRNPLFGEVAFIRITGVDINDIIQSEVLSPKDDGLYRGSCFFKEVTAVETEGWTGRTRVYWSSANQSTHTDPYKVVVFEDFEAPLKYQMSLNTVDGTEYSFLSIIGQRFNNGVDYRRPNVEDMESEEELTKLVLLDDAGAEYSYVDFCLSSFNSFLYVLDDTGKVHVYDVSLPNFTVSQLSTSLSADPYMRVDPLNPYPVFGDTEKLFTSLFRPRWPVNYVIIKRVSPTGVTRYLQSDKTWGVGSAQLTSGLVQDPLLWQEITFESEYDEMGQWEYWVTCATEHDSTVNYTAVIAGSLTASISLASGVASPLSLSIDRKDQLQIGDGSDVYRFSLHKDCWIPRDETNQIVLREEYSSIEVTY